MKRNGIVTLIGVFVVLVVFSVYYVLHQNDLGRRSNLVGDGICGSYVSEEDRDGCCASVHEDDSFECAGEWDYVTGIAFCQFVCGGQKPICGEDVKICDDGSTVERNSSRECFFDDC